MQKVEAVGQKVDEVIKPTAYPNREALPTHMGLLQPENGVIRSTTDPAHLTGALTPTMEEALQVVTWDEVCMADMSNGAGDPCSAHPLLQYQTTWETHWEGCQHCKMNANFLSPGWTSPSAQGIGKYPKQISKSVERTLVVTPSIWRLHHWRRHKACG